MQLAIGTRSVPEGNNMVQTQTLIKTKGIAKATPQETLAHALSKTRSSHDAVFVFENDVFLGIVNPYYAMIKTSHPGNTKLGHCLHVPPKVSESFSISRLAGLFVESKLHYLPVFGAKKRFVGIVSARRLLSQYRNSQYFDEPVGTFVLKKRQKLQTIQETDTIAQALAQFRKARISKLVVVDKNGRMQGMLSHYDLIMHLSTPKERERRFDRVGERTSFQKQQIKTVMKSMMLTLGQSRSLGDALEMVLHHEIGSVIVLDGKKHPVGIVTTSDFLKKLVRSPQEKKIEVSGRNLSKENETILRRFAKTFERAIAKVPGVASAGLMVKEEKHGGVFKAIMSIVPVRGAKQIKSREGKNLKALLAEFKKIRTK